MLIEVKKNSRVSAKDIQKSLEDTNLSVDEATIRKILNKSGDPGRPPGKEPMLSKTHIAAWLKVANVHLNVPQRY